MQVVDNNVGISSPFSNSDRPVVRTLELSKRFKKVYAVKDAGLEAYAGDVFGLLGPNGAGKTTIIRMMLGLLAPSAGSVEVFGFSPTKQRAEVLKRVSAIVEAPALYPSLTGRDNLKTMAMVAGVNNPAKLDEVIEKMGLAARAKDRFGTYSLGMKQRLCIAAALLTDPQLIILDEPTNGLDPAGMAEIRQLIKELASQGRTVFLSSHLLNEVQQVCNRVAVIQKGKIIAQGLVEELLAGKTSLRIKVLPDDWEKAKRILQSQGWADRFHSEEDFLVVDAPASEGVAINRALATQGVFAGEIYARSQTLEEYYLELTGE
ncbi:MAG: ABC transporter ATP-binding protein [Chloroflexi bacterium]|nr:ABC transporter ATP-binding protein [Chloroflexota bacterium]